MTPSKPNAEKARKCFVRIFGSPIAKWLSLLLPLVPLGCLILNPSAIREAWPLAPPPGVGWVLSGTAAFFWILLAVDLILFILRDIAKAKTRAADISSEDKSGNLGNWGHLGISIALFGLGLACLCIPPLNALYVQSFGPLGYDDQSTISLCSSILTGGAILAIALVNLYSFRLIWACAWKGDPREEPERWPGLPDVAPAVFIVAFIFAALVFAFARLYLVSGQICHDHHPLSSAQDALYYSLVTMTTLGYGDFSPSDYLGRWLVIFQLASGLIFLMALFPVLASRLADFGISGTSQSLLSVKKSGSNITITRLSDNIIIKEGPGPFTISVKQKSELVPDVKEE